MTRVFGSVRHRVGIYILLEAATRAPPRRVRAYSIVLPRPFQVNRPEPHSGSGEGTQRHMSTGEAAACPSNTRTSSAYTSPKDVPILY